MARRIKRVDEYAPQFKRVIEKADLNQGLYIEVEGTGREKANKKIALRAHLYRFMAAIREEIDEWEKKREGEVPWAKRYVEFAKMFTIVFEGDGIRLKLKQLGVIAQLLGKAVDEIARERGEKTQEEILKDDMEEALERYKQKTSLPPSPQFATEPEERIQLFDYSNSEKYKNAPSEKDVLKGEES